MSRVAEEGLPPPPPPLLAPLAAVEVDNEGDDALDLPLEAKGVRLVDLAGEYVVSAGDVAVVVEVVVRPGAPAVEEVGEVEL